MKSIHHFFSCLLIVVITLGLFVVQMFSYGGKLCKELWCDMVVNIKHSYNQKFN